MADRPRPGPHESGPRSLLASLLRKLQGRSAAGATGPGGDSASFVPSLELTGPRRRLPGEIEHPRNVCVRDNPRVTELGRGWKIGGTLRIENCPNLRAIDRSCEASTLEIVSNRSLQELPTGIAIDRDLLVWNCARFRALPPSLHLSGDLDIRGCPHFREFPESVVVAGSITICGHTRLEALPNLWHVRGSLRLRRAIDQIPAGLRVDRSLSLERLAKLESLPEGLEVGEDLRIGGLSHLRELPAGLRIGGDLFAERSALETLPGDLRVRGSVRLRQSARLRRLSGGFRVGGGIDLSDCARLEWLPPGLRADGTVWPRPAPGLDLGNCERLKVLPVDISVEAGVEVAGSGISGLPAGRPGLRILWRGTSVPARVAFDPPESFAASEVFAEANAEVRRVLISRLGIARLLDQLSPEVLDSDRDPGGPRRLLRIRIRDEWVARLYLECRCPSTGRQHHLRVPPTLETCHAAAAWLAGFEDPDEYRPLVET